MRWIKCYFERFRTTRAEAMLLKSNLLLDVYMFTLMLIIFPTPCPEQKWAKTHTRKHLLGVKAVV